MGLVIRALLRDVLRRPWQVILAIISIAAGVAVVVGVDVANTSAMAEFDRAGRVMDGAATHRLTGGTRNLDETVYQQVRVAAGIMGAAPVIRGEVLIPGDDEPWILMGIDPLSDFRFRSFRLGQEASDAAFQGDDWQAWPLYASGELVQRAGAAVSLTHNGQQQTFNLLGSLEVPAESDTRLLITDIAWSQDFLGLKGRISYVDLKIDQNELDRLTALLPDDVRLFDLAIHQGAQEDMSRAFRINLTALSLLALVVAMFLVYSAISFQVVRRQQLFGQLGVLGVSGKVIAAVLLGELILLGLMGSALGIVLGRLLAEFLTALVTGTISALYHQLDTPAPALSGMTMAKALLVGIPATVFSGLFPVVAAGRRDTLELLRGFAMGQEFQRLSRFLPIISAGLVVMAGSMILWSSNGLVVPFAGLFLLIIALSLLGPWLLYLASSLAHCIRDSRGNLIPKMALGNASRHLGRTGVAVSALTVAVSATLGVELMIQSFRYSVVDWLNHYLRADIYLSAEGSTGEVLPPEFVGALNDLPQLQHLSTGRRVTLSDIQGPITVFALDVPREGFDGFKMIQRSSGDTWPQFHHEGQVLISEPLARRRQLQPGDRIELPTDRGVEAFNIAAIYRDYSSDRGLVTMDWRTWERYFDDPGKVSAALYLQPESDVESVMAVVRALPGAPADFFMRSNRGLKDASLKVFDQTFRITAVLRWLAMVVAVVGIFSALMALLLDRRREFSLLSAVGLSRLQISGLLILESGLAGLIAGLVAVPLGMLLSLTLIRVINVRSFGWSMESLVDWNLAWQSILLAVCAAMAAAVIPAWRFRGGTLMSGLRGD